MVNDKEMHIKTNIPIKNNILETNSNPNKFAIKSKKLGIKTATNIANAVPSQTKAYFILSLFLRTKLNITIANITTTIAVP